MALLAGSVLWSKLHSNVREKIEDEQHRVAPPTVTPTARPAPAAQGYVGSEACATCHAEISEKYKSHGMQTATMPVASAVPIEDYATNVSFTASNGREYRVERTAEGVFHHERMVDNEGRELYDQKVKIDFVVGSGRGGRSYVSERDGFLYQSPISWYVKTEKWGLSPGYETKDLRFERRLPDGCVACHIGRSDPVGDQADRYRTPALIETGISCERCHGPGAGHVAFRTANPAGGGPDATIVNPARLEPRKRESVCNQCHLLGEMPVARYGRTVHDFRPGELLEDTWVSLATQTTGIQAVSHVDQMRESRCFGASEGKLGCLSCHDPHETTPPEQQAEAYSRRCNACHADRGCSLDAATRRQAPANDSCIHCHMPRLDAVDIAHAAQTDHRILRSPAAPRRAPPQAADQPAGLKLFDQAETRLPKWELNRVQGTLLFAYGSETGNVDMLDRAEMKLKDALPFAPDDVSMLVLMGSMQIADRKRQEALKNFVGPAFEVEPKNERLLSSLISVYSDLAEFREASRYAKLLVEAVPSESKSYIRLAETLRFAGDRPGAIEALEKALEINPASELARGTLIKEYESAGKKEEAARHRDLLDRLQKTSLEK